MNKTVPKMYVTNDIIISIAVTKSTRWINQGLDTSHK